MGIQSRVHDIVQPPSHTYRTNHRRCKNHRISPTIPLPPNLSTTPFLNLNVPSISSALKPCLSRIEITCLIVNPSRNCLPAKLGFPTCSASFSAALAICSRALKTRSAGFEDAWGKIVWVGCVPGCGWKVLEGENVGAGLTGPMWRREAAKSGSRPSMSIAILVK